MAKGLREVDRVADHETVPSRTAATAASFDATLGPVLPEAPEAGLQDVQGRSELRGYRHRLP